MADILSEILEHKRKELEELKKKNPLWELKKGIGLLPPPRSLLRAINSSLPKTKIIAEVKKASPSKGFFRSDFDPVEIAKSYEEGGAVAISVITETHFFKGSFDFLSQIKRISTLPLLCKDFILEEYQIFEARVKGADALLLITSILEEKRLQDLLSCSQALGLEVIAEVHSIEDLEKVLPTEAKIIGINNRNLKNFTTDLNTTLELLREIPKERVIVSESGIKSREDILRLKREGVSAFLIGEALLKEREISQKLRELLS